MALRIVVFLAIIFTALALVPSGAHLFALLNKIELDRDPYFTVQQIYAGWSLFGIVIFGALIANLTLTILLRGQRPAFHFALLGFLGIAATLVIFFAWTYPANLATANWTEARFGWDALRRQWEYSHAVNAVIAFVALCSVTLAALTHE